MNKIEIFRKQLSFTQEELAQRAGVSRSKIYLYENGKGNPTTKTLAKIAKALNVETKELM